MRAFRALRRCPSKLKLRKIFRVRHNQPNNITSYRSYPPAAGIHPTFCLTTNTQAHCPYVASIFTIHNKMASRAGLHSYFARYCTVFLVCVPWATTTQAFAPLQAPLRTSRHPFPLQQNHLHFPLKSPSHLLRHASPLPLISHNGPAHGTTLLAGKLWPLLQKLKLGVTEFRSIGKAIRQVTDWQDVVVLVFLAFCTPFFSKYRNHLANNQDLQRFGVTKIVSDIGKVALSVYVVDVVAVVLTTMGFTFPRAWKVSEI